MTRPQRRAVKSKRKRSRATGPAKHRETKFRSEQIARITARRKAIYDEWLDPKSQLTMTELGRKHGVSVATVCEDIESMDLQQVVDLETYTATLVKRRRFQYDKLITMNFVIATSALDRGTRRDASETLLQAMRDEQRMLGIGKGDVIDAFPVQQVAEALLAMQRGFTSLFAELVTDPEVQQRWYEALRDRRILNQIRPLLGGALQDIEVAPAPEPAK